MPADNKWFTRLIVAAAIVEAVEKLDLSYPKIDAAKKKELDAALAVLARERSNELKLPQDSVGLGLRQHDQPSEKANRLLLRRIAVSLNLYDAFHFYFCRQQGCNVRYSTKHKDAWHYVVLKLC